MRIKIHFFATLRDYAGAKAIELDVPLEITVAGLKDLLVERYPKMSLTRNSLMAAINREYAGDDQKISINAEIAFFPPVSGG